jgi:ribose 5-phosphate isomerase RpiB
MPCRSRRDNLPSPVSNPNDQIDRIVSEVLSRLGHAPADEAVAGQGSTTASAVGELQLTEQVVSVAALSGRLNGIQRIVVPARAVITPSARDLLREKNISLVRALKTAASVAATSIVLAHIGSKLESENLGKALAKRGLTVRPLAAHDLGPAVIEIAAAVSGGGAIGVLLVDNAAAAVCVANRNRGVRAAIASNRGDVNDAIRSVGANVLVVDPRRRGQLELQRIIETFAAAPARKCPTELKAFLD